MNLMPIVLRALLCATVLIGTAQAASPGGMDALLQQIQQGQTETARIDAAREQRFVKNRNEQAALLQQAERELAVIRKQADGVRARFETQKQQITALREQLKTRAGDYVQVASSVRELAAELRAQAADSMLTAQFPERIEFFDALADGRGLPSFNELETLWFTLTQEMAENGKVARFEAEIVDASGVRRRADVVRVGAFTAFADGEYLTPSDQGRMLTALARQPSRSLQATARAFAKAGSDTDGGVAEALVDPSRGSLLRLEGEKPGWIERIHQGGLVGYVILVIGAAGLVIALLQMSYLELVHRRVRAQIKNMLTPHEDNPLGRLMHAFARDTQGQDDDPELLELKLSEAVLRETPPLERAQSILKLFIAAAPLLGLLGTVTGMIVTFQAITMFGSGDPRLMADGISQALVTTVQGLSVALPLLFLNGLLATRARSIVQVMDEQSARLLAERLEGARG